jgi:tetratricopeptide (TPR) repeat protein
LVLFKIENYFQLQFCCLALLPVLPVLGKSFCKLQHFEKLGNFHQQNQNQNHKADNRQYLLWYFRLEQWQYAKDDLDKVLFLNNTNIAGLFYRAFVNEKLLRYNFARLDYQNLLVLVPGNFQAQLGLALLNEKDKHYTEAYDGINSLIEQYPDSAMAYAARGGMEKERGMLELAEFDYAKAMELDAGNEDFAFNHVDILILLGRKDEAYRDLKKLLDAGCQPGRLQGFYARLKKKKK